MQNTTLICGGNMLEDKLLQLKDDIYKATNIPITFMKNKKKINTKSSDDSMYGTTEPDEEFDDNEEKYKMKEIKSKKEYKTYTWSSNYYYESLLYMYIIQSFIKDKNEDLISSIKKRYKYSIGYNQEIQLISEGSISFIYKNKLYVYISNLGEGYSEIITETGFVDEIVEEIEKLLITMNPWRGKYFEILSVQENRNIGFSFKNPPIKNLNDVILNEKDKNDIYDNSIFHLEKKLGMNGILLYGVQGTGKSAICSAIAYEAMKKRITVFYITDLLNFSILEDFIEKYISPCIMILEDIDSFAQSREYSPNSNISPFLNFMSGISAKNKNIVVIANTNYIDHLDKAINRRPMRFNRLIKFDYPTNENINKLIDIYFKDQSIDKEQIELCYDKKFTGAHIEEILRTCKLLAEKNNKTIKDVFDESVDIIKENFSFDLNTRIRGFDN